MKSSRLLMVILMMIILLAACNLPAGQPTQPSNPNAVFTAAAQTVEVQLTQNALLNPSSVQPTFPPATSAAATQAPPPESGAVGTVIPVVPTPVPNVAPTASCDSAQFVADISVPDGTVISASATYTKTWRLKNVGTCTWNSAYVLVFDSGDQMGGPSSTPLIGTTAPGASLDVSVNLQAPAKDGLYRGFWGLVNGTGARVPVLGGTNGNAFYVDIKVGTGTASGGATSLPGTESADKFKVLSVGFSALRNEVCSSATGKYVVTATITTNKSGNVNYTWVRSDGVTAPGMSDTVSFDAAGSKTVTYEWVTTLSGVWMELYVDKPNHQQFGRINLSCP